MKHEGTCVFAKISMVTKCVEKKLKFLEIGTYEKGCAFYLFKNVILKKTGFWVNYFC